MKKILATVLALSVFSVSASTQLEGLKSLEDVERQLVEYGVDVEAFKESALELNLDPTLTDAEVAETVVDFTRSQLETGAAYETYDKRIITALWVVFALSFLVYYKTVTQSDGEDSAVIPGLVTLALASGLTNHYIDYVYETGE